MTSVGSRMRAVSFRARLGTFTAVAVLVTVALASLASYFAVRHQLYSQVDKTLKNELTALSRGNNFDPNRAALILRQYTSSVVQVNAADNSTVYPNSSGGPPLPFSHAEAVLANSSQASFKTVTYEGQPYRVIAVGASSVYGPAVIQIATPLADITHTLRDLRLILWLVTVGGAAVAVGLGYLIGRTTMRPVVRLTAAAEHVAETQDLEARIDEEGDDELARLARTFNSMLAALASSRRQQAQLISDAGHELRTPLTSLRTNMEVLMRVRDLPESDRSELAADVHAQLEEMTTLVGDLVELAREDEHHSEPIEIRFDSLVERAVERARRRAPKVLFETAITPGSVRAQPALLERAVLNVLDNAVKWTPPGAAVRVELRRGDRWALDVRDQGPGIAAQDLPYVFDRFYRAASARSMPGSGLGLAIVRQVVADHGGRVTAFSPEGGGTLVHIELPTVAEHEPDAEHAEPRAEDPESHADSHGEHGDPAGDPPASQPVTDQSVTSEPPCPERDSNSDRAHPAPSI